MYVHINTYRYKQDPEVQLANFVGGGAKSTNFVGGSYGGLGKFSMKLQIICI